jgi:5-methylcytosine-specific restriction protein A
MTGRSVPEWIGSSPDAKVPPRVRLRIFEREGGKCWISGRKIRPGDLWDLDHKVALINGGEHRESNLFPALRDKHRQKTREDVRQKSEAARVRSKHLGIRRAPTIRSAGFAKREKQSKASSPLTPKFPGDILARKV